MHSSFASILAFGLIGFAAAEHGLAHNKVARQAPTCVTGGAVHLMVSSGRGETTAPDTNNYLQGIITDLTNQLPGTDEYLSPYHGDPQEARNDVPQLVNAIESYVQACPDSPIALLGYSLGGILTMNTICGPLPTSYQSNVVAIVLFGEETFRGGQPYDRSTCTASAPQFARADVAPCQAWTPVLNSYCLADDPRCCSTGTNNASHFAYFPQYNGAAESFIGSQVAKFYSSHSSSSSSTSTSSSSSSSSTSSSTTTTSSSSSTSTSSSSSSTPTSTSTSTTSSTSSSTSTGSSTPTTTVIITSSTLTCPASTTITAISTVITVVTSTVTAKPSSYPSGGFRLQI